MSISGYVGKLLRVDLTSGEIKVESIGQTFIEKWVGGVGFGASILYSEVPPVSSGPTLTTGSSGHQARWPAVGCMARGPSMWQQKVP